MRTVDYVNCYGPDLPVVQPVETDLAVTILTDETRDLVLRLGMILFFLTGSFSFGFFSSFSSMSTNFFQRRSWQGKYWSQNKQFLRRISQRLFFFAIKTLHILAMFSRIDFRERDILQKAHMLFARNNKPYSMPCRNGGLCKIYLGAVLRMMSFLYANAMSRLLEIYCLQKAQPCRSFLPQLQRNARRHYVVTDARKIIASPQNNSQPDSLAMGYEQVELRVG